ncbi:PPC domain-containing DNA-binding protein [Methanoregula sp.]|jgi:predicted DNA-binding protein with PD1-like motif|uniref:PPC domain-containing DNA-binding protein n=1 Tax=Methanoregula sp. TaxID=2052170 RepID=UPI003C26BBFE
MQYSEGRLGRVFVLRIDDGEDFLAVTQKFIQDKSVRSGTLLFLGALRQGRMVTGPEVPTIPPEPHFIMFEGGWEMVGLGTISEGDNAPAIHFHASVGRAGHALTGCLREKAITYIVAEVVILEFSGLDIHRRLDEKTGVPLPVHTKTDESGRTSLVNPEPDTVPEKPVLSAGSGKREEEVPGGLAEIIRDLTRRPRA